MTSSGSRDRVLAATALAVFAAWFVLVLRFGGLHFDDFTSIWESRGAATLTAEEWLRPAADGRWQPLKRITFDLVSRAAGLTFWPYAIVLAAAHVLAAAGVAAIARAIRHEPGSALHAGFIALASLNLSAYCLGTVGTLHGIISVGLAAWAVAASVRASAGGRPLLFALAIVLTLAACLYKETVVTTPALAVFAIWLAAGERLPVRRALLAIAAPAAGLAVYFALRVALDIPLVPARSRYALGVPRTVGINAALVLINVAPWFAAAILAAGRRYTRNVISAAVMSGAALALVLPSLLLSWTSPNFWYALIPPAALGTSELMRRAERPRRASAAIAVLMVLVLTSCVAVVWRYGLHRWGPYSESSVRQWTAFPRSGGRVIWFDADSWSRYGGLARTIGPGYRLAFALRFATGDPAIEADVCISVPVAGLYQQQPGDEFFLHSQGRLQKLPAPPPGRWYCPLP